MARKPTYEELEQRVKELDKESAKRISTEKVLKESEERFRLLYERAPLSYQSLDKMGCIVEVNQAWLDTLGYNRKEVIGKSFGDFLHPDWTDHFKENFSRFKAIGEVLGLEFEMVKKDDSNITVSFHGKIGLDKKGEFKQTHCILYNITERKRVEEALQKAHNELESRVQERTAELESINERMKREIEERKQVEEEREKLIKELQEALKEIKTLRGILPLCSFCKKIRDDQGYWEQVDVYIHKHLQADISHSLCPDCAKEHYPDLDIFE